MCQQVINTAANSLEALLAFRVSFLLASDMSHLQVQSFKGKKLELLGIQICPKPKKRSTNVICVQHLNLLRTVFVTLICSRHLFLKPIKLGVNIACQSKLSVRTLLERAS